MMNEELQEDVAIADEGFWDDVQWDMISKNKISKEDFLRIKIDNPKLYGTFLGGEDELEFYMFSTLPWGLFKKIKSEEMDKLSAHEAIVKECLKWPKNPNISKMTAGILLTLVYQILSMSNFLPDPSQALKMIIEV